MRIDPARLLVLRAVVDAGGVVAAARRLHLAPSGVSQHLAALERETGLVLLDRSHLGGRRPARPTTAGRRLAEHANRLADVLAEAEADVQALSGSIDGPVALAVFPTAVHRLAAPALVALARTAPAVRPRLVELDEGPALAALHAGEMDMVLVEDDALHPRAAPAGTAGRPLLDDPYRLALPADWPVPDEVADLAGRPWVDGPPDSAVRRVLDRLRVATGLPLPGAHSCVEFPAALALVDAGLAAALVPDLALTGHLPAGVRLISLPGLGARRISAVHRTRRSRTTPVVGVLLDALSAAAATPP
jgi:DNA-binding transcriptional LysR family regulator